MGVIDNLGYIKDASYYPCASPDPILVIEAGATAVFPVLFNALTFGCLDIVKTRAGMSPWHSRGMHALIKDAIPASQRDIASKLLRFTIPLEKALFFWFVVDLTTEFFARWQSQLFKLGGCTDKPDECNITGTNPFWVNVHPGEWIPIIYGHDVHTGHCQFSFRSRIVVPSGYNWSCSFSLSAQAIGPHQSMNNLQTRIVRVDPVYTEYHTNITPAPWFGNNITSLYTLQGKNDFRGTAIYELQAMSDVSSVSTGGTANITVSKLPFMDNRIIPMNCFGAPAPNSLSG